MELFFNNIRPKAFEFRKTNGSIWGQEVRLKQPGVYQIVASSGSGKSTLVAILSGLRNDHEGALIIGDKDVAGFRSKAWSSWRSQQASFVFQDLRLFPELSAMDNILMARELNGSDLPISTINNMAEQLGVGAKLGNAVKKLSYGQMQRVAILRAISRNYQWLILDEPFSHLDLTNAQLAWNMILEDVRKKNAGVIITSLDPYPFIQPDTVYIL